jgi:hypothetical protein
MTRVDGGSILFVCRQKMYENEQKGFDVKNEGWLMSTRQKAVFCLDIFCKKTLPKKNRYLYFSIIKLTRNAYDINNGTRFSY